MSDNLQALVRLSHTTDWNKWCGMVEDSFPEVHSFLETWGPHCGASRDTFRGHLCAMLRDMEQRRLRELWSKANAAPEPRGGAA
jgi:hypothetical protein